MTSTKLAFLTEATDAYSPYQGAGNYDDMIRNKMESLVREAYPWLGDFTLAIVDSDRDNSYACAAGTLRGFSSGYAVEFPVFYLDGDIMDIPTFVLPERKLMLPFDESFYKIITSTLNNSDDMGLVREREDVSDALVNALADTDYHNVSEVIKMGSFSRIASFIPRRMLKSYAKTACGKCPELIRDFYSAIKLSQARSHVKTAAAADTAKLTFREEDNMPFTSIVSPVFLSEAEAKELDSDGTETEVVKICDDCYVLPQANNKLSLTNLPSAGDIAKTFGHDFEYLAPGEWICRALNELKKRAFEPFVSICPSSTRDFWVAPVLQINEDHEYGLVCSDICCNQDEFHKLYDLAKNNLGGEYATFEKANRKPFNEADTEFMNRSMVFYFPQYSEKRNYLSDILSNPLSLDHGIENLIRSDALIPVMTSDNKFALLSLTSDRRYSLDDNKTKKTKSNGKQIINFMGDNDEVCIKVIADSRTGNVKSIVYRGDYAPNAFQKYTNDYAALKSHTQYVTLEFDDKLKTFDPNDYTLANSNRYDVMELKPNKEGEKGILIGVSSNLNYMNALETLRNFTHKMYDPRCLDKDFVLNGFSNRNAGVEVGMPVTEITVNRDGKTIITLPKPEKSVGPKIVKYTYLDPEKAVQAMAHLGIEPEDLKDAYEIIRAESDHLASINSNGFTKLGFALAPAAPAEEPSLNSEAILQQATVMLQNIQDTQAKIEQDNELRSRMLDTQLQLVNEKLDNVEQLQAVLEDAVAGGEDMPVEEVPQPEPAAEEEESAGMPPEVIETLVSVAMDPSTAEANDMGPDEVSMLQAAAQGDEEAAASIGLTGKDYALFLQLYHENIDQMNYADSSAEQSESDGEINSDGSQTPSESESQGGPQPTEEDLTNLANILADPKAAKLEMESEMVDNLVKAALGNEEAAAAIGITVDIAKRADAMAEQIAAEKAEAQKKAEAEDNINTLAQMIIDPESAKQNVGEDMVSALLKAVKGDAEAAESIGITVSDAQAAAFRATQQQTPAEPAPEEVPTEAQAPMEAQEAPQEASQQTPEQSGATPEGSSDEDINTLAQILTNESEARMQVGDDMVESLLKAVDGDAEAAAKIGITVADAQAAAYRAGQQASNEEASSQSGEQSEGETLAEGESTGAAPEEEQRSGLTEEDAQAIAEIVADPEAAKQQYEAQMVDTVMAAYNGDEEAASQLGTTVEEIQQAVQSVQGGEEAQGGEEQQPQTPEEAAEQLKQTFDQAVQLVEAYLDPSKVEEYNVSTEDLGTCTLVLRSPDAAIRAGVPGETVQAISDAYKMITGKSVYQSAELEFENGAGNIPVAAPNLAITKTAIPESKAFEEYSKPLIQTSALLDLLPKVKTAKLFFKNADAFRDMLTTLGEILINLQVNSVQYKDSLGSESFKKLLTRIRKMYEDFGTTILEMYSLDKE